MDLNEAIIVARKCLHYSPEVMVSKGITESDKYKAYDVIAEYHSRINLLYKNAGATETVLSALYSVEDKSKG